LPRAGEYAKLAAMRSQIVRIIAPLTLIAAVLCGAARADGPDIRKLMTPEEFEAAGLDKLSPQEIEALNRWVVRYTAHEAPEVRRQDAVVKVEAAKADAEGIKTRIAGAFSGWDGDTVFRLQNGQVWKQRLEGRWHYRAESPEVELRKNMMGFWVLRVVEPDKAIGVKRLQ
jgi:hypothetical protein